MINQDYEQNRPIENFKMRILVLVLGYLGLVLTISLLLSYLFTSASRAKFLMQARPPVSALDVGKMRILIKSLVMHRHTSRHCLNITIRKHFILRSTRMLFSNTLRSAWPV